MCYNWFIYPNSILYEEEIMNSNKEKLTFIFPKMKVSIFAKADIICISIPGIPVATDPNQGEWDPAK